MKKTLIIASLLMVMIFAGCSSDSNEEPKSQNFPHADNNPVTLTVSAVATDTETSRVAYGSTDATWETGDKIFLIKSDGTTIILTLSSGAGTSVGTFTSTDPVAAGSYIPYAVSATSLSKGYVSIAEGQITLDLTAGGGGTLADALEHNILKGNTVTLTENQTTATIENLTTHILSYLRFQFTAEAKAISTIGVSSAGGINQTVTIATNGAVTGSNPTTSAINVTAGDNGANTYAGYIAVYGSTSTSLVAHAEDAEGGKYSRLISTKTANYVAGKVYGKSFTLSNDMMNAAATGTLSDKSWKNLGLSVKWAEFNVGSTSEYSYDRNVGNEESESAVPSDWAGWRLPTRAEMEELFYVSNRQWVTGTNNGVKFNCNGSYLAMGAGGYYRWRDDGNEWFNGIGETVYTYIDEITSGGVNGNVRVWAVISNSGTSLGYGSSNLGNNKFYFGNTATMRLVCDY